MIKILIAEPTHQVLKETLEKEGNVCDEKFGLSIEELCQIIHLYKGLVIRSKYIIDSQFIDLCSNLKFIARAGSGMENIDTEYAENKGILCINSPEGNRDSVGEHALGMLLCLLHKINTANNEVKSGIWNRQTNVGTELHGKTVGILGYGNMGSAFAQRLKGFDVKVIAYDRYKTGYSDSFVKEVNLETFYKQTEIFSIHIPLDDKNKYLIDDKYIKAFKNNIYLINTARGGVLRTDDLVKNLKSGKISGSALDVLEYEKTSFEDIFSGKDSSTLQFLINSDKVILTPHVAGSSEASFRKIAEVLADKIIEILKP